MDEICEIADLQAPFGGRVFPDPSRRQGGSKKPMDLSADFQQLSLAELKAKSPADLLRLAEELEIETAWKSKVHVPAADVGQIRIRGGRVAFLSDLEPQSVVETAYFSRLVPWRRDQGFDGEPAKVRGKVPLHAIAMHARSVLTYALDGPFEKFKATLAFDDSAGTRGRVDCRILVDGREVLARRDFRASQEPIAVDVPLAGGKQLTLEVDFGPDEDVGDRIVWAEPRLFRAAN